MPLITISQDTGSRGRAIARAVADQLGVELYDDERLKEKALEFGVKSENFQGVEAMTPGFFDRLRQKTPQVLLDVLQNVVFRVAEEGEGVILGHGSQILLENFDCALHVRVFASFEKRVQNAMMLEEVEYEQAKMIIKANDSKLNRFFKYAFQRDKTDPSLYDIIINTEKLSVKQAAEVILNLYRSDEMQSCSIDALDAMRRLALEKKIHAILLQADVTLDLLSIEVPQKGVVHLSGFAEDEDEKVHLLKTLEAMDEVSTIKEEIRLHSDFHSYQ